MRFYLARNLRNCKHVETIFSLCFVASSVVIVAEVRLPVETLLAGFSRSTKFSTSVNTPVCMQEILCECLLKLSTCQYYIGSFGFECVAQLDLPPGSKNYFQRLILVTNN